MSASHHDEDASPSRGIRDRVAHIAEQFEADWQQGLAGAPPPDVQVFLERVEPQQRFVLRETLLAIEQRYRQQQGSSADEADSQAGGPDPTVALRGEAPAGPSSSVASDPQDAAELADGKAMRDANETSPAASGLAATIDPGAGDDAAAAVADTIDHLRQENGDTEQGKDPTGSGVQRQLPLSQRTAIPGYEILGELGRGGMGVVYRARQIGLNRLVALKMILAGGHAAPQQLARFRNEAESVAQLQHPNIVQVYDVGERDGLPYFSLEFVDGQSLDEQIDGQPLLPMRAAELIETTARAMHYAHQQGIVHRDLKPANILLTRSGVPKITDFGLVKRLEGDSSQTRTGTIMGTPSYMAPEQGRGEKEVGPLADVYALGSVLYCLLTGHPPFLAAKPLDTLMQLLNDEPVPPSRLQPKTPADLETICLKCLQKDPQRRYESAQALADDLARFRDGAPIMARPASRWERMWRWCRRNPRVAIPSAAAVLFALALMIGGPVAAMVVYQQKELAVENEQAALEAKDEARRSEQLAVSAKEQAQQSEQMAAKQRQLALDSLKTLVQEVQAELQDKPRMQPLRQKLLQSAMSGLNQVAETSALSTQKDIAMAGAFRRMGDIYLELGNSEEALKQYQRCHEIVQQLAAQGRLPRQHHNLSFSWNNMGEAVRRSGDPLQATKYFLEGLAVRRKWSELQPDNYYIPQNVAESLGRLGQVALMAGKVQEAHDYYLQSLKLREEWLTWDGDNPTAQAELAGAQSAMADVSTRLGKVDEAERYMQTAINAVKQLADFYSEVRQYRWNLALFYNQLGTIQLLGRQYEQAAANYRKALPILREFSDEDPLNARLRQNLSLAHYGMGTALLYSHDPASAEHYQQSCRLRQQLVDEDPTNPTAKTGLMLSLARCGHHARAAEIASQLRAASERDPHTLYYVATGYAVCAIAVNDESSDATRQQYVQRALDTLQDAVTNGYQVTAELRLDPDLEAVRDDPQFQSILEGLQPAAAGSPSR